MFLSDFKYVGTQITNAQEDIVIAFISYLVERKLYDLSRAISTYNLGTSSLIEAILKNQFLHVSLADSGTSTAKKLPGLILDLKMKNHNNK